MPNEKTIDGNEIISKVIDIEAMLEVAISMNAKIIANQEGRDHEEVKREAFNDVERVAGKLWDTLNDKK